MSAILGVVTDLLSVAPLVAPFLAGLVFFLVLRRVTTPEDGRAEWRRDRFR